MYPNQIDEKSNRNIFDGLNTEKIGGLYTFSPNG
jgi:hypothetical protein